MEIKSGNKSEIDDLLDGKYFDKIEEVIGAIIYMATRLNALNFTIPSIKAIIDIVLLLKAKLSSKKSI